MNDIIIPVMRKRERGGWMAVSRREDGVRIGAIGDTEAEARARFLELAESWRKARDDELAKQPPTSREESAARI